MVRVRVGGTWKQDPSLRAAIARGGAAAQDALLHTVDAVAVEVDGVDVCAGEAEGSLVSGIETLATGLLSLLGGQARAHVHFAEGGLELVVARRGSSARLTVVRLRRPARVLVRDVEVELTDLVRATAEAATALALDVRSLRSRDDPTARGLLALAARLDQAQPAPEQARPPARGGEMPRPRTAAGTPSCTFELHDDDGLIASYRAPGADLGSLLAPGRVVLRASDGRDMATLHGPPFLIVRDLLAFAAAIAAATRGAGTASASLAGTGRNAEVSLEADLRSSTLLVGGARKFACPPLLLGRAICEAAGDLAGVVVARNPWQERNGWLVELRNDAAERMAQLAELVSGDLVAATGSAVRQRGPRPLSRAPLAPGRIRRLAFRRIWSADVGAGAAMALDRRGAVIAAGGGAVIALDAATGTERWRRGGAPAAWVRQDALFLSSPGRLVSVDPATGTDRWSTSADALPHGAIRDVRRVTGGGAVATGPGWLAALDAATGRVTWAFAPPAALEVRAAAFGSLVLAATDAGFLYALDAATGALRWRLHLPGPLVDSPAPYAGRCILVCATDLGGSLLSIDPGTGHRAFELPLDVTPVGPPVPFAGLLGLAATVGGDSVVTAVDPEGRLAWEDAPPLGAGPVTLAALRAGLLAKTADGACSALDRGGETTWSRGAPSSHPPAANVPPVVARGVALVPSEQVVAVDTESGARLGEAPIPAPVQLACDGALNAWGVDADGVLTAARLETHLSVL